MSQKLIRLLKQLRGLLPERNPIGRTEFDVWADLIFSLYNLPAAQSYRFTLCSMVLNTQELYRSKYSYAKAIRKAQVNETAYQLMSEIKQLDKQNRASSEPVQNNQVQITPQEVVPKA